MHYDLDGLNRRVGRQLVWGTPTYQYFLYDNQDRVVCKRPVIHTLA